MTTPNTAPVFTMTPKVNGVAVGGAANTKSDGSCTAIGTDMFLAFTAGLAGSFVSRLRLYVTGTVAATATVATTHRVYVSTQTTGATTSANTWLIAEISVPILSADKSTTANIPFEVALGFALPAGYTILVSTHVINNANTGWVAVVMGSDY